jgi:hypothetical protein
MRRVGSGTTVARWTSRTTGSRIGHMTRVVMTTIDLDATAESGSSPLQRMDMSGTPADDLPERVQPVNCDQYKERSKFNLTHG